MRKSFSSIALGISVSAVLVLSSISVSAQEIESSRICPTDLDKAAGGYADCLLVADGHYVRDGDWGKFHTKQWNCRNRFEREVGHAIGRYGEENCAPFPQIEAIESRAAEFSANVALEATGISAGSRLFVQFSDGATLTDTELVLNRVNYETSWFSDRPYRSSGQVATDSFIGIFSELGVDSFVIDPPNAEFSCMVGGELSTHAVILSDPVLGGDGSLSYGVSLINSSGGGSPFEPITCDGEAYLFIDSSVLKKALNFFKKHAKEVECGVIGARTLATAGMCIARAAQAEAECGTAVGAVLLPLLVIPFAGEDAEADGEAVCAATTTLFTSHCLASVSSQAYFTEKTCKEALGVSHAPKSTTHHHASTEHTHGSHDKHDHHPSSTDPNKVWALERPPYFLTVGDAGNRCWGEYRFRWGGEICSFDCNDVETVSATGCPFRNECRKVAPSALSKLYDERAAKGKMHGWCHDGDTHN